MKTHEQKLTELRAASTERAASKESEFAAIDEAIATHRAADPDKQAAIDELREALRLGRTEIPRAGADGLAALERLARVVANSSTDQTGVIMSWLASVYNGGEALRVQLDDIRRLDWALRKDLLAVVLGCSQGAFSDTEIRKALLRAGGEAAVDRLHWYTTREEHHERS